MSSMQNLSSIADFYKTDKYEHGYTKVYEKYFDNIRDQKLKILEIGIADGNGDVSKNLNLLVDKTANYMGTRSARFAMIIRDNNIDELLIEEPGEYKRTSAENLLTKI